MRLELSLRHIPWRSPLRAAHSGAADTRPLILVRLEDQDGASGYGEAAPLEEYDGVGVEHVMHALGLYQLIIGSFQKTDHTAILRACLGAARLPQAIAAVDMALWDLEGRTSGRAVWELLGGAEPPSVNVNATIGAEDPLHAGAEAAAAAASGYTTVKVKVGVGDDVARVQAVRAAVGGLPDIRIDANGAWTVIEAVRSLRELDGYGIEFCEEPVHGVDQLMAVSEAVSEIAISADETASDPRLYNDRVCAGVCLKIARCGGITGVMREVFYGQKLGYDLYLASTLDGPLGIAAALHTTAAFEPDGACGLATLSRFEAPDVIPVEGGMMQVPDGPGLGDGLLEWY